MSLKDLAEKLANSDEACQFCICDSDEACLHADCIACILAFMQQILTKDE